MADTTTIWDPNLEMALSCAALRYAFERRSTMPGIVAEAIRDRLEIFSVPHLERMAEETASGGTGDDIDRRTWRRLNGAIRDELWRRQHGEGTGQS